MRSGMRALRPWPPRGNLGIDVTPSRSLRITALLAAISCLGCEYKFPARRPATPRTLEKWGIAFPVSIERAAGERLAAEARRRFGEFHFDPSLQRYVDTVGRTVAARVTRTDLSASDYRFGLLQSDEAAVLGCPGGVVYVTRGMVRLCEDEAQLAGVLAHGIASIDQGVLLRLQAEEDGGEFVARASMAAAQGSSVESFVEGLAAFAGPRLLESGPGPEWVCLADWRAVELAVGAGYNPQGLTRVLNRIAERRAAPDPSLAWFLSTQGPLPERVRFLDRHIQIHDLYRGRDWRNFKSRFQAAVGGLDE